MDKTPDFDVDVVVIGAGSAGLVARRAAMAEGATVLMCDPGPYGTTCARVGCMPSKLLIAPAEAARSARQADRFGIAVPHVEVDAARVLARVRSERDRFAGFVVKDIESLPATELLPERVTFTGPDTLVSTTGKRIKARAVVIATGSSIIIPGVFKALTSTLLTSDTIFELQSFPKRLAVIGGGIVGLELGQAMANLGATTMLFDSRTTLGPTTDPDVSAVVVEAMGHDMELRLGGAVTGAEEVGQEARLTWTGADGSIEHHVFDAVLVAVGRAPNICDLGLETTGAPFDARGVPRFDANSLHIDGTALFVAGDANGLKPLLHEATDEGRIAGRNAADFARHGVDAVHRYERRAALAVAFAHPQIAMAGLTFAEAMRRGAVVGAVSFRNQGRARVQGENFGLMRIYGEPGSGRLLGVEMCCPGAEHMGHLLAWAIQMRMSVLDALEMPFYHPVLEEGLRTALRELAEACGLGKAPPLRCLDCGPGH